MIELLLLFTLHAADWPRFRGPNGTGVGDSATVATEFGPAKNVIWKVDLPGGHSSPVLAGDRIFLTAIEQEKLYTLCLDRATGKTLWRRECPRPRRETLDKRNNAASPTPAVEGRNVYVFFGDFGLVSYDFDGRERWRSPLGPFDNLYGMGVSPVVAGGNVVLVCDQSTSSFVVGVGKDDGRVRWKTPRAEAVSGHSTPVVYQPKEGGPPVIIAPGSFRMDAYSSETGQIVWWVSGLASEMKSVPVLDGETVYINGYNLPENDPGRQVTVPDFAEILAKNDADRDGKLSEAEAPDKRLKSYFPYLDLDHDGKLTAAEWKMYAASMKAENGLLAIRIGGRGDLTEKSLRWKYQKAVPQLPSTLLYQGVLYMISDAGVLSTFDPETGELKKQARLRGAADRYYASPVAASGKVFIASHTGVVSVLKAGGDQELLAANELDEEIYATPAIADGRIYIRTRGALYCFGERS